MVMKAITIIDEALSRFQRQTGLVPRVILVPPYLFQKWEAESKLLDEILPRAIASEGWADVRMVEHELVKELEIY